MALVFLLLVARLHAATPVLLPAGESPDRWAEALALAGLTVGAPGAGASVEVTLVDGRWVVRARDAAGMMHQTTVPPPTTEQAREDFAWLVASLVRPLGPVGAPSTAVLTPTRATAPRVVARAPVSAHSPAAPPPSPALVPSTPSLPSLEPSTPSSPGPSTPLTPAAAFPAPSSDAVGSPGLATAPTMVAPLASPSVATEPMSVVPPRRRAMMLDLSAGTAVAWRSGTEVFPSLLVAAGVSAGLPVRVGLRGERALSSALSAVGEDRAVTTWGGAVTAEWMAGGGLAPSVGLDLGVEWRRYEEDEDLVAVVPTPVAGVDVGVTVPLLRWLTVAPGLGLGADLRPTDLVVPGTATRTLSPWTLRGGVTMRSSLPMPGRRGVGRP